MKCLPTGLQVVPASSSPFPARTAIDSLTSLSHEPQSGGEGAARFSDSYISDLSTITIDFNIIV